MMRVPFTGCPLCDSAALDADFRVASWTAHERYRAGITEDVIRWSRCRDCGHVFTSGYFDGTLVAQLFSSARPGQRPQLSASYLEARPP